MSIPVVFATAPFAGTRDGNHQSTTGSDRNALLGESPEDAPALPHGWRVHLPARHPASRYEDRFQHELLPPDLAPGHEPTRGTPARPSAVGPLLPAPLRHSP